MERTNEERQKRAEAEDPMRERREMEDQRFTVRRRKRENGEGTRGNRGENEMCIFGECNKTFLSENCRSTQPRFELYASGWNSAVFRVSFGIFVNSTIFVDRALWGMNFARWQRCETFLGQSLIRFLMYSPR